MSKENLTQPGFDSETWFDVPEPKLHKNLSFEAPFSSICFFSEWASHLQESSEMHPIR